MSDGLLPRRFDVACWGNQGLAEAQQREQSQGMPRHHRRYAWDEYGLYVMQYCQHTPSDMPSDEDLGSGRKALARSGRIDKTACIST